MKVNRHVKIVELVNKYTIETQEDLTELLKEEGFQVTQATVSRDIRDLKLTKVQTDDGKQKYFDACIERSKRYDISNFRQYIDLYKELMKEKK